MVQPEESNTESFQETNSLSTLKTPVRCPELSRKAPITGGSRLIRINSYRYIKPSTKGRISGIAKTNTWEIRMWFWKDWFSPWFGLSTFGLTRTHLYVCLTLMFFHFRFSVHWTRNREMYKEVLGPDPNDFVLIIYFSAKDVLGCGRN